MPEKTKAVIITAQACQHAAENVQRQISHPVKARAGYCDSLNGLPDHAQSKAAAKAIIVKAVARIHAEKGGSLYDIVHDFISLYKQRKAPVPEWVYDAMPKISRTSINRWSEQLHKHGMRSLAKIHEKRMPRTVLDTVPKVNDFVLGMLYQFPHTSGAEIERALIARFGPEGTEPDLSFKLPCKRRIQVWLSKWKEENAPLLLAHINPDASRSNHKAAFGDAGAHITELNQEWQSDGTLAELMLSDGRRHTLNLTIDVYSRRLSFHVSRTSSAAAVASGFRKCLLRWGTPETWKTDNGSDYKNKHMERICGSLGIYHDLCPPFSPEKKPYVERAFRSFLHSHVEIMQGYLGHSVAERKDIEARRSFADRLYKKLKTPGERVEMNISPEELQRACDDWAEHVYGNDPHEGLGGVAPNAKAAAWDGEVRRILDERALDILLLPCPGGSGLRTVRKKGIRITSKQHGLTIKGYYIGVDVAALIGRTVLVRLDDTDLGRAYLFDPKSHEYLGKAENPHWLGWSAEDIRTTAVAAVRHQKAAIATAKKEWKEASERADVSNIDKEIVNAAIRKAAKNPLTSASQTVEHITHQLEQAGRVHTSGFVPPTDEEYTEAIQKIEELTHKQTGFVPPMDDHKAYQLWTSEYQKVQRGEAIDPEIATWMEKHAKCNGVINMHLLLQKINPETVRIPKKETPAVSATDVPTQCSQNHTTLEV